MQAGVSPGSDMQGLPTVVSANGPFFYELDDLFRLMPPSTVEMLSLMLSDDCPMSDWKMVADRLGNSSQDIEMFSLQARHPPNFLPCSRMLIKWSKRDGSTIRVLKQTFEEIGRTDAASLLEEERKREHLLHFANRQIEGGSGHASNGNQIKPRWPRC
jgi:hypothetical protein